MRGAGEPSWAPVTVFDTKIPAKFVRTAMYKYQLIPLAKVVFGSFKITQSGPGHFAKTLATGVARCFFFFLSLYGYGA